MHRSERRLRGHVHVGEAFVGGRLDDRELCHGAGTHANRSRAFIAVETNEDRLGRVRTRFSPLFRHSYRITLVSDVVATDENQRTVLCVPHRESYRSLSPEFHIPRRGIELKLLRRHVMNELGFEHHARLPDTTGARGPSAPTGRPGRRSSRLPIGHRCR